jgi:hypothetical protein
VGSLIRKPPEMIFKVIYCTSNFSACNDRPIGVLPQTDTGVKAHDLKRGKSKSLGSWMSKHADKMEAIRVAFSEPKASDSPRKEASLAETTKKAVHTKKAKGKSRNAAAEETANKRASGKSIAVKGGQTEAVVVQETRGGRRGGKRVGEEPLASGWPSNGEPTKKPRTGNTAASAVPELVSAVEQPAGVTPTTTPHLRSQIVTTRASLPGQGWRKRGDGKVFVCTFKYTAKATYVHGTM